MSKEYDWPSMTMFIYDRGNKYVLESDAVTEIDSLRSRLERAVEAIQAEIDRAKNKDCIGCCNGNDIPAEELCRACWRIWVNGKMYPLWDIEATEARIKE